MRIEYADAYNGFVCIIEKSEVEEYFVVCPDCDHGFQSYKIFDLQQVKADLERVREKTGMESKVKYLMVEL